VACASLHTLGGTDVAIVAAILFGLALLCELLKTSFGTIGPTIMTTAGLLFFALHFGYTRGSRGRG
jgi:hypothetical protein